MDEQYKYFPKTNIPIPPQPKLREYRYEEKKGLQHLIATYILHWLPWTTIVTLLSIAYGLIRSQSLGGVNSLPVALSMWFCMIFFGAICRGDATESRFKVVDEDGKEIHAPWYKRLGFYIVDNQGGLGAWGEFFSIIAFVRYTFFQ
jgi:hypothetical protein